MLDIIFVIRGVHIIIIIAFKCFIIEAQMYVCCFREYKIMYSENYFNSFNDIKNWFVINGSMGKTSFF